MTTPQPPDGWTTIGAAELEADGFLSPPEQPALSFGPFGNPAELEALRVIRAAWAALPPSVRHLTVLDGATLDDCIRAIPVGDPPLVSAALAVLDEIDRIGHVGEDDPTVGRLRDALSRPTPTKPAEENS